MLYEWFLTFCVFNCMSSNLFLVTPGSRQSKKKSARMKNWILHCLIWFGVSLQQVASSERKDSLNPHKTDKTSQSTRVLSMSWDGCAVNQDGSSVEKKFDILILGMGLSANDLFFLLAQK